jgi:hypothetical protein
MDPLIWLSCLKCISSPSKLPRGLIRYGKLPAGLFVIIYQDLAPRAACGVGLILEPLALVVH